MRVCVCVCVCVGVFEFCGERQQIETMVAVFKATRVYGCF